MKKVILGVASILLLLICIGGKVQARYPYYSITIREMGFTVRIRDKYDVFASDVEEHRGPYAAYNTTEEKQLKRMAERNMHIEGWNPKTDVNLQIIAYEEPGTDFVQFTDEELKSALDSHFEWLYSEQGMELKSTGIYYNGQVKFHKSYATAKDGTSCQVWYFTTHNNHGYNILFVGNNGSFTVTDMNDFEEIASSFFVFDKESELPYSQKTKQSLRWNASGSSTFVPGNWIEAKEGFVDDTIKAMFLDENGEKIQLIYQYEDIYEDIDNKGLLGSLKNLLMLRSDVNMRFFDADRVADLLDCDPKQVKRTRYGSYEFFLVEKTTNTMNGEEITEPTVCAAYFSHGCMHLFTYLGSMDELDFQEFEFVLKNARLEEKDVSEDMPWFVRIWLTVATVIVVFGVKRRKGIKDLIR